MTRSILTFFALLFAFTEISAQEGENFLARPLPDNWSYSEETSPVPPDNNLWWQNFGDTQLDSLISLATERN